MKKNYIQNGSFHTDLLSLLPLDILYLYFGVNCTILRMSRVLKYRAFLEFFDRLGVMNVLVPTL